MNRKSVHMLWHYVKDYPKQRVRRNKVFQEEENISGKVAIVTGSNCGLGKQTALELARRGAEVVLACRDFDKACEACVDIIKEVPHARLKVLKLDLADLDSIRDFVRRVKKNYSHVDILINNAGVRKPKFERTKHGFETNIGINHLGPFLLTILLLDLLQKSEKARIICVSSSLLYYAKKNDLMNDKKAGWWNSHVPYANSKMANALFVKQLTKVLNGSGNNINCYGVCPGLIFTDCFRHTSWFKILYIKFLIIFGGFSVKKGCDTILYCALSTSLTNESGKMYRFLARWDDVQNDLPDQLAASIWEESEARINAVALSKETYI